MKLWLPTEYTMLNLHVKLAYLSSLLSLSIFVFCFPSALHADAETSFPPEQFNTSIFDTRSDVRTPQEIHEPPNRIAINEGPVTSYENINELPPIASKETEFVPGTADNKFPSVLGRSSDFNPTFDTNHSINASGSFEQSEILSEGHAFFGNVTEDLAAGVEYLFQNQGKPNAYILGEDAGGAFLIGLRYGEGLMHIKNSSPEKVFWQGPTIGYDAGAEGSKTMILVYNLKDPSEIYDRYAGVQGSAYFIGGLSIQLQKHDYVTLAVIRSGIGLRLGANIGYLNYTRTPTWNPL